MAYKLDIINKRILYELDKNCRISDNQLAKKVNLSRESVRNRIKKLENDGIIQGFITSINPSKFGYMFFKLYFQLVNNPKKREKFYGYLKKIPGLYWFGGNDGVWDLHATLYSKNVEEFNSLKNKIYTEFKDLIIKRDVGVLVNVRQYPKRYLIDNLKEISDPEIFADNVIDNTLDDLDKKILNNLARNARIGLVELSGKTKSSVDIIRNRIKKMEEKKIILQYRIAIDHTKLGYEMFKAFVYFNNLSEEDEKRLFDFAIQNNKILYLIRQLSSWDIELEIMAKNYDEFNRIMDEIRLKFVDSMRNYEFVLMREDIWVFGEKDIF
jgi:DNA-binding Lrp family transcriptional regulator